MVDTAVAVDDPPRCCLMIVSNPNAVGTFFFVWCALLMDANER